MQPTRTEAIRHFLDLKAHPDLAQLYNHDMEVQVNVGRDGGEVVEQGDLFKGKGWRAFTNGDYIWKPFRIPFNAKSDPTYDDVPISFPLSKHVEGIGMTGWDWKSKLSRWVAFDFDAILGHSERHAKKLDEQELAEVERVVKAVPFVTLRKSTSGKGLHLYVFLDPVETANHTEHAALARAILSMLSGLTGYDFSSKVDICGGNMWVWHRKMYETSPDGITKQNEGLKVIKQGSVLSSVPANWRDHIDVVTRKTRRTMPSFVFDLNANDPDRLFAELTGQRTRISLDSDHRALIDWLANNGCTWWWDTDSYMVVTHTTHLRDAHEALRLRGRFETIATGKEKGFDHNCFCFPVRGGAWAVRRYSLGTKEHETWETDNAGWTRCFLNREPDLPTLARLYDGVEHEKGGYAFKHASDIVRVLTALCVPVDLPTWIQSRPGFIKPIKKEDKLVVHITAEGSDNGSSMRGWLNEKKLWKRVFNVKLTHPNETESNENYDDIVRHIISTGDSDAGWVLKRDKSWVEEPLVHVKSALSYMGNEPKDVGEIVGASILRSWVLVNKPFQPEYPGNREWNRGAAQFAVLPTAETENLSYPTWQCILNHCGEGLNEAVKVNDWCKAAGITRGSDYLMLWIASMLKQPEQPTTYLAFWGPQDSGKSIFHEMISEILITGGCVRADHALQSQNGFNGELLNAILAVVEETDLKRDRTAYNRIKDWVTSPTIMIRAMQTQGYMVRNMLHFVQTANDLENIVVFDGDTRITVVYVDSISPEDMIPKPQLMQMLKKEAADFLAAVLALELPQSNSRLAIPTLSTESKSRVTEKNRNLLETFIAEKCFEVPGHFIKSNDFYEQFTGLMGPRDKAYWTQHRVGRDFPERFPKGRLGSDQDTHYGNITFDPNAKPKGRFYRRPESKQLAQEEES